MRFTSGEWKVVKKSEPVGFPVCDTHKDALTARLGDRIHFYLVDNTPVLGTYTLCEAHLTGCKNPATHRYGLVTK